MIRAGTIGRVPTWTPDPARFPRFALLDGPSPLAAAAAALGRRSAAGPRSGSSARTCCRSRSAATSCATSSSSSARRSPRAPTRLVTSGRRWSNHARLTAAAGARAGLAVHLVLSGPPADPPNPGVAARRAARRDRPPGRDRRPRRARGPRRRASWPSCGRRAGGRTSIGVGGSRGRPARSARSLAGLRALPSGAARARSRAGRRRRAVGDRRDPGRAAGRAADRRRRRRRSTASPSRPAGRAAAGDRGARRRARRGRRAGAGRPTPTIVLDGTQLGDGYGRPTEAADEATRLLARTEGILVDPIYTAKALAGLIALVRSGALDGQRVVFWHAGGTPGLFEPLRPRTLTRGYSPARPPRVAELDPAAELEDGARVDPRPDREQDVDRRSGSRSPTRRSARAGWRRRRPAAARRTAPTAGGTWRSSRRVPSGSSMTAKIATK